MHYTVDYKGMDRDAKRAKAIADTKWFLGDTHFQRIMGTLRQEANRMTINRRNIRILVNGMSFCGVQGYPAKVVVMHAIRTRHL